MKLSVGITKKVGLPGFGSVGATCQLESGEFSSDLSADAFRQRVARAFDACRQAVETELRRHAGAAIERRRTRGRQLRSSKYWRERPCRNRQPQAVGVQKPTGDAQATKRAQRDGRQEPTLPRRTAAAVQRQADRRA